MYLNKVFIIGNLTKDPELKALPSGTKVASFGLATNSFFKDKDGQWWSTFFGNDKNAPFTEKPGILRVEFDKAGRIRPLI